MLHMNTSLEYSDHKYIFYMTLHTLQKSIRNPLYNNGFLYKLMKYILIILNNYIKKQDNIEIAGKLKKLK